MVEEYRVGEYKKQGQSALQSIEVLFSATLHIFLLFLPVVEAGVLERGPVLTAPHHIQDFLLRHILHVVRSIDVRAIVDVSPVAALIETAVAHTTTARDDMEVPIPVHHLTVNNFSHDQASFLLHQYLSELSG